MLTTLAVSSYRSLRDIVTSLGGRINGYPRQTGFDITAASEVMVILGLSTSLPDLRQRLGRIVVAETREIFGYEALARGTRQIRSAQTQPGASGRRDPAQGRPPLQREAAAGHAGRRAAGRRDRAPAAPGRPDSGGAGRRRRADWRQDAADDAHEHDCREQHAGHNQSKRIIRL